MSTKQELTKTIRQVRHELTDLVTASLKMKVVDPQTQLQIAAIRYELHSLIQQRNKIIDASSTSFIDLKTQRQTLFFCLERKQN